MQIKKPRKIKLDLGLITYENKTSLKTENRFILRDNQENITITWSWESRKYYKDFKELEESFSELYK